MRSEYHSASRSGTAAEVFWWPGAIVTYRATCVPSEQLGWMGMAGSLFHRRDKSPKLESAI